MINRLIRVNRNLVKTEESAEWAQHLRITFVNALTVTPVTTVRKPLLTLAKKSRAFKVVVAEVKLGTPTSAHAQTAGRILDARRHQIRACQNLVRTEQLVTKQITISAITAPAPTVTREPIAKLRLIHAIRSRVRTEANASSGPPTKNTRAFAKMASGEQTAKSIPLILVRAARAKMVASVRKAKHGTHTFVLASTAGATTTAKRHMTRVSPVRVRTEESALLATNGTNTNARASTAGVEQAVQLHPIRAGASRARTEVHVTKDHPPMRSFVLALTDGAIQHVQHRSIRVLQSRV